MAFDGLVTRAAVHELADNILYGKIEKIYQPDTDELVFNIHTKAGKTKLYATCSSSGARVDLTDQDFENPAYPSSFCMLMRKHFSGGRITSVSQRGSERIIEIEVETLNEMSFSVNKKIIFEIMGKHSNITALDMGSGKIIDCIKHVSFDVNRVRQLLPGKVYEYPPVQDKVPFDRACSMEFLSSVYTEDKDALASALLSSIGGISPAVASETAYRCDSAEQLFDVICDMHQKLETSCISPCVYTDSQGTPVEFHVFPLLSYESCYKEQSFDSVSEMLEFYYSHKVSSNRIKQKSKDLSHTLKNLLSKMYLKKQRLSDDMLKAEDSEHLRLYGELLTAGLHSVKPGSSSARVLDYYTGNTVDIPLDVRMSPARNAQNYYRRYGKAKTAVREKALQLEEVNKDIEYLESVSSFVENASSVEELEEIRSELVESGYLKKKKDTFRTAKKKAAPYRYEIYGGFRVSVGRNNRENDMLTLKTAGSKDIWLHTKDIPGSHVILFTGGLDTEDIPEQTLREAASLAAYYSKARSSGQVPVDYVNVKHVKKPNGARPGMVIFTNNRTLYADPCICGKEIK